MGNFGKFGGEMLEEIVFALFVNTFKLILEVHPQCNVIMIKDLLYK